MAAPTTPAADAAKAEADAKAAEAEALTAAKEVEAKGKTEVVDAEAKAKADAEAELKRAQPVELSEYRVVKNFVAHVGTQLVSFVKDDILHGLVGKPLYEKGAAVVPVEAAPEK
jgi:hypothetical protein